MVKKFILNADDLGLSKETNKAVCDGYDSNFLQSVSLVANGEAFDDVVNSILPKCPNLGVGIHLNVIEGKALSIDLPSLTNSDGFFNNSFLQLLVKTYNPKEKNFLAELEKEFRAQIEKVISKTEVTHIDSHVHVHAIPRIFDLVCSLAKEYGISQVRTQHEKMYFVSNPSKYLTFKFFINIIKVMLLKVFTKYNKSTIKKYNLRTNDYLLGVLYTSMMDGSTISYGLLPFVNKDDITIEGLIHPARYEDGKVNNKFKEFLILKNTKLKENIEKSDFRITNYAQ